MIFTVIFYGLRNFGRKMAQLCATRRESKRLTRLASATLRKPMENMRKNSFLNYESPALTAELQAHFHR